MHYEDNAQHEIDFEELLGAHIRAMKWLQTLTDAYEQRTFIVNPDVGEDEFNEIEREMHLMMRLTLPKLHAVLGTSPAHKATVHLYPFFADSFEDREMHGSPSSLLH